MYTKDSGQKKRGARSWAGQLGAPSSALLGVVVVVLIGALLALNLPTQVIPATAYAGNGISHHAVQLDEELLALPHTTRAQAPARNCFTDLWE